MTDHRCAVCAAAFPTTPFRVVGGDWYCAHTYRPVVAWDADDSATGAFRRQDHLDEHDAIERERAREKYRYE